LAYYDLVWYANAGDQSTTGYYAVAKRPQNTAVVAGQLARQFTAPAVGSERVFVCIVAGTTANVTDATWVLTRGAKTTDGTATWQECTGASAVNGDLTNTANWTAAKAIGAPTLGAIIQRNSGASYWICTTAGALGASEPAWASNTAGTTQIDGSATWTCLGAVGNFTGGQAPHARLANACASTWLAAGNTVYVGDNHAESQTTALTVQPALSQTTVSKIICHNHAGPYPPAAPTDLATTATISTTAAQNITFNFTAGAIYVYGMTFVVGVGQSAQANLVFSLNVALVLCEACVFKLATTNITAYINLGLNTNANGLVTWRNCQVSFAAAAQYLNNGNAFFAWQNTAQILATGSTTPTNLFGILNSGNVGGMTLETLDLSPWTAVFITFSATWTTMGDWTIKDCKLNASAIFSNPTNAGHVVQIIRADGGATAYKSARYAFEGTETTETSITRVGGASDPTGQAQSRKIVTTVNSQWLRPFQAEPYAIWNPTTAANVTVTVYGTINAGALPNNDDIWIEVEYIGSSTFPIGTIKTTTKASLLAANAAVASDSSSWNGGGSGAGWTPFKLTTTLSSPQPGMVGYLHVRVRAAKPSATYYIDPKIVLT
jgi:hypothetical protein